MESLFLLDLEKRHTWTEEADGTNVKPFILFIPCSMNIQQFCCANSVFDFRVLPFPQLEILLHFYHTCTLYYLSETRKEEFGILKHTWFQVFQIRDCGLSIHFCGPLVCIYHKLVRQVLLQG